MRLMTGLKIKQSKRRSAKIDVLKSEKLDTKVEGFVGQVITMVGIQEMDTTITTLTMATTTILIMGTITITYQIITLQTFTIQFC
jgi:hypothetical protein